MANALPLLLVGGAALFIFGRKGPSCPKEVHLNVSPIMKDPAILDEAIRRTGDVELAAAYLWDRFMPKGCKKTDKDVTVIVTSDDVEGAERMPAPVLWHQFMSLVLGHAWAKQIISFVTLQKHLNTSAFEVAKFLGKYRKNRNRRLDARRWNSLGGSVALNPSR